MSIFKETLRDFVCTQLRIREAIIEQGNNPSKFNHRFGNPRNKINVNGNNKTVGIAAGAFYTNTVHKQCIIRMTSGVDVTDKKILEFGEDAGDNLAKSYILEGGVLDKNQKQRSGFARSKGAYGAKSTRSNATDGFGIVPMPGIIDAEIRTKTAYGSLREAKINFVCHNRRQLEVLELLYMRPGMPILLEWGWNPFISNKGKITNSTPTISDDFFDGSKTIDTLNNDIRRKIETSGGNYDGFIGFCKNFEIKSRSDGGYDCTTELIAMGEALESLKARKDGDKINREGDEDLEVDSLEFLLEAFQELGDYKGSKPTTESYDPDDFLNSEDKGKEYDDAIADALILNQFINKLQKRDDFFGTDGIFKLSEGLKKLDNVGDDEENNHSHRLRKELNKLRGNGGPTGIFDIFFLFKGEKLAADTNIIPSEVDKNKATDTFIRWDLFCLMINLFVFPERKSNKEPLVNLVFEQTLEKEEVNGKMTYKQEYLEFAPYTFPTDSTRNEEKKYKVVKNPKSGKFFSRYKNIKEVNVENLLNASFNPNICLLPNQIPEETGLKKYGKQFKQNHRTMIGLIHLNVEHLKKVYMDMAYNGEESNKDFNIFDYIKKIWDDVNTACCGRHEFTLQTELENPNNIRIIDLQVNGEALKLIKRENLFEFKIQSNKSIVRDYNFNTTIPSEFSATIAIAAQAPTSIEDLDQVTFANFNKGIKSRFTVTEESQPDFEAIDEYNKKNKKTYDTLFERYKEQIIQLAFYKDLIEKGRYDNSNKRNNIDDFNVVLSLSKSIESTLNQLLRRNPTTGLPYKIIPKSRAAIVPLKFNAQIDGIGGLIIGNVFVVEKEKLPKGYQADNIAFVIMGESQKITSGQDWTTDFSGQLILTDDGNRDELDKKSGGPVVVSTLPSSIQDNTLNVQQPIIIPEIIEPPEELEEDLVLPIKENKKPPSVLDKFVRNDGSGKSLLGDGFIYEGGATSEIREVAIQQAITNAYSQLLGRTSFSGGQELYEDYVYDAQPYIKIISIDYDYDTFKAIVKFKFQEERIITNSDG